MKLSKTSEYISYIVAVALFFGAVASCKKNSSPASYNTNKATLLAAIDSLTTVYNSTVDGSKPGDYIVGARAALDSVINLATQVSTSTAYTQQEITNALNNLLAAGATFSTQLIQQVSLANLVGYWTFNGNPADSSGNGHDGTLSTGWVGASATSYSDGGTLPQLTTDRFGRQNMAYNFNNGAYIDVPYSAALNPQTFTILLWEKVHTISAGNYMFSLDRWNGYKFQLQQNNFLFLTVNTSTGDHDQDTNPTAIDSLDVWYHVAVSYTNGTEKFYINGKPAFSTGNVTGVPLTLTTPVDIAIGNEMPKNAYNFTNSSDPQYFYGANFFVGSLDEIRLYNIALTDAQILSIYTDESSL